MGEGIGALVQSLRPAANRVSARANRPVEVLEAMWEIGEILQRNGITKPHSVGEKLQVATGGIVKRPLVFRSAKIRSIWRSPETLRAECWGLRSTQNVIEMLPFLDPGQRQKYRVSETELKRLRLAMVGLSHQEFYPMLRRFKRTHADMQLGQKLDRERYLPELRASASALRDAEVQVLRRLEDANLVENPEAIAAVSSMLKFAAGATETQPRSAPTSLEGVLQVIGDALTQSGALHNIQRRKRLWRLYSRERLLDLGEMVEALAGEELRRDYFQHRNIARALTGERAQSN